MERSPPCETQPCWACSAPVPSQRQHQRPPHSQRQRPQRPSSAWQRRRRRSQRAGPPSQAWACPLLLQSSAEALQLEEVARWQRHGAQPAPSLAEPLAGAAAEAAAAALAEPQAGAEAAAPALALRALSEPCCVGPAPPHHCHCPSCRCCCCCCCCCCQCSAAAAAGSGQAPAQVAGAEWWGQRGRQQVQAQRRRGALQALRSLLHPSQRQDW